MPSAPLIVLIHGAGGNAWTMFVLETYLRHWLNVPCTIIRPCYPSSVLSIETAVDIVNAAIAVAMTDEHDELIVIGQSLGGIIGYRLADRRRDVRLLVTIGSPLHGASLVGMLRCHLSLYESWLRRPVYDELERCTTLAPPRVEYHSFTTGWAWSTFDGCVFVDEARFADDDRHTHFAWGDHRFIIADPRLLAAVASKIVAVL